MTERAMHERDRRHILTASLGVLALPLAACSAGNSQETPTPPPTTGQRGANVRVIRDFGAIGNGVADDTQAILDAFAGSAPVAVYFPTGTYKVTRWPEMRDYSVAFGDGADLSTIVYGGSGPLVTLSEKQRVTFRSMGFFAVGNDTTCVQISHSFGCVFDTVLFRGQHTAENYPQHVSQTGIILNKDSGGTRFNNCDINNFGTGLITSCIQNYVTGSRFITNYVSILGTGNDFNAGLALTNVEFVSTSSAATKYHINIDGAANDWWITNSWFEGCQNAILVGKAGVGGPSQFGMVNCKVAAASMAIDLQHCRQPFLANIKFDEDRDGAGTELQVNMQYCPEGTAIGLITSEGFQIDPKVFPEDWNVLARSSVDLSSFFGTIVARAQGGVDKLQTQDDTGQVLSAINAAGEWISASPSSGIVLQSPDGTYWRLTVSDRGDIQTANLGQNRP